MSLIASSPLYEALRADVVTAWAPDSVTYGLPQVESPTYPYAVVRLSNVPMQPAGARIVEQSYRFECMYVDAWQTGSTWNVELAKEDIANALITRLLSNPIYASFGYMPQILSVDFDETDDPIKPRYSVSITFEVIQHVEALV